MLNYKNWKKLNENMMSFNLGMSKPQNMGVMSNKEMASYMDEEKLKTSKFKSEDEDIEDEDIEDEDDVEEEDEVDEIDMEDAEDEESEDEEYDDEESEDEESEDEESEDEESEDTEVKAIKSDKEDESEMMHNMKKSWSDCGKYMSSEHEKDHGKNHESEKMDNMKTCWSGCGSYMASENTMPKHMPSFEDWQKSVSSMLDNTCVTKKNFDGVVINESKK